MTNLKMTNNTTPTNVTRYVKADGNSLLIKMMQDDLMECVNAYYENYRLPEYAAQVDTKASEIVNKFGVDALPLRHITLSALLTITREAHIESAPVVPQ